MTVLAADVQRRRAVSIWEAEGSACIEQALGTLHVPAGAAARAEQLAGAALASERRWRARVAAQCAAAAASPIASPAAANSVRLPAPRGTPSPQLISNAVADRQQLYQRLKAQRTGTPPRSAALVSRHLDDVAGRLRASTPG